MHSRRRLPMGNEMFKVLRLRSGNHGIFSFDLAGAILRHDTAYRERRRLSELTPEQLRDVGLTRADIERSLDRE